MPDKANFDYFKWKEMFDNQVFDPGFLVGEKKVAKEAEFVHEEVVNVPPVLDLDLPDVAEDIQFQDEIDGGNVIDADEDDRFNKLLKQDKLVENWMFMQKNMKRKQEEAEIPKPRGGIQVFDALPPKRKVNLEDDDRVQFNNEVVLQGTEAAYSSSKYIYSNDIQPDDMISLDLVCKMLAKDKVKYLDDKSPEVYLEIYDEFYDFFTNKKAE